MPSLTAHEEKVYLALKSGSEPMTVGEVASKAGLEREYAVAFLKTLEGYKPPLARREVDAQRGTEIWIALLCD